MVIGHKVLKAGVGGWGLGIRDKGTREKGLGAGEAQASVRGPKSEEQGIGDYETEVAS